MSAYWEPPPSSGEEALRPRALLAGCFESGSRQVLLDRDALPPEFFDLSTRRAGELLHELGKYRIRVAAVVPDASTHSKPFQDFVRESNRRGDVRFFATRREAIAWLDAAPGPG